MPYTISHTAAVLPFSRWLRPRRLLSAAVIGSMIPDLGYLLPYHLPRADTHALHALFAFCLPAGLACYWLFQLLIKPAALEALPDGAYAHALSVAASARIGALRDWLRASVGVLAGAITHLSWDAFTHEGARGVRMFPALNDNLADVGGHRLLIYKILEQGSSVIGLLVVLWIAWRALTVPAPEPRPVRRLATPEREAWCAAYPACALLAVAVALGVAGMGHGVYGLIGATAIAVMRGLAFAAVAVSLVLRVRLRRP